MAKKKAKKVMKKVTKKKDTKQRKITKVMREYESGELHSGSKKGPVVKDKAQALAIGYSEARKAAKGKKKKKSKKK